ncbi:hypothetical protein R3P38DRAFT_716665 [Favolaschia claudopus]|uniref:Nephrocystin 3-like N-terminal domain-containing protein n=1 Tax=Favolaschia claudopus TaxID=2862362 RepID=A0AAV9Z4Y3_9AGAR
MKKILESDEDIEIIETAIRKIDGRLKSFHLEITMSIENKIDNSNLDAALRILWNASATEATHDAAESFTHPPCHPNTRLKILDQLTTWSQDTSDSASQILWMHGPAGTGKSAIAQSFCQQLEDRTSLGASFFFKQGHQSRGNSTKLWPTIAYQLALISDSFKAAIAMRLISNPALIDKSLPAQLQRLVVDPYNDAEASNDRTSSLVIVIDGLDECQDETRQQEILRSLAKFLASQPLLRILIVSRPEAHIKQVFGEAALSSYAHLIVPGSSEDVEVYLTDEFKRIRETHAAMASISCPWPEDDLIHHIIDKSSGHFIYAATIIRFVEDDNFDPAERLVIVTQLRPQHQDSNYVSPFSALDELYLQILSLVPYRPQLSRVFSVIAAEFTGSLSVPQIGQLLGLKPTEILLTIRKLHSLIKIDDRPRPTEPAVIDQHISVYHASFLDFLRDPNRSRIFYFSDIDRQNLATDMLEALSQNLSHNHELESRSLLSCLPFITTTQLTPKLISLLYRINLDLIMSFRFPVHCSRRFIEWLEAPLDLIQEWEENFFIGRFNHHCADALITQSFSWTRNLECELPSIDFVQSATSSDLIRIIHIYRLGTLFLDEGATRSFGSNMVPEIQQLSDKDVRTIISATRPMLENSDDSVTVWFTFLWSVAHPTRIRELHPDPSLEMTAIWCMNEIGRAQKWPRVPPSWSYILRSCLPAPVLLNVLHCNKEHISSFIARNLSYDDDLANVHHEWHNILQWLQTFPDPPIDMLEYVKNHLPADYVEDDTLWIDWKEFTGW